MTFEVNVIFNKFIYDPNIKKGIKILNIKMKIKAKVISDNSKLAEKSLPIFLFIKIIKIIKGIMTSKNFVR